MNTKRLFGFFIVFIAGFTLLQARLFILMTENATAEQVSSSQSVYRSTVAKTRPDFFDCNGQRITGSTQDAYALLYPNEESSYNVVGFLDDVGVNTFVKMVKGNAPFMLSLTREMPEDTFIDTVKIRSRYAPKQLATHLVGYLDYDKNGVSGLELAFDEYLKSNTSKTMLELEVNAQGAQIKGSIPKVYEAEINGASVGLMLDSRIQKLCEVIANEMIESGAIVVLDSKTAEIKAMVSRPNFDPRNISAALNMPNSPLVNKAITAYNVGSIYKPIIACSAVGAGIDASFNYECIGTIEVDKQKYSCNNGTAHGVMDVEAALVNSCNTFFIALGQELGAEAVFNTASSIGANRKIALYGGLSTSSANMPTVEQLKRYGELCNHCFGQGRLMLTPLHVAAATNAIASGGLYTTPTIVAKIGGVVQEKAGSKQVFTSESAKQISEFMAHVVSEGTGKNAEPKTITASGKTGTAQTGSFNKDGTERIIGWFTGWFPAEEPRYTVVVMTDDAGYGFESAAPVFARIADEITACGY